MELVRVTRSGLLIIVCVSVGQRENVLGIKQMGARKVNCFAPKKRAPMKKVITGVAVNIKVDQLRGRIQVYLMFDATQTGWREWGNNYCLFYRVLKMSL